MAMEFRRRTFLRAAVGAAALPVLPVAANAEAWPARAVHVIVAVQAGLAPDVVARLVGPPLGERLGQAVVVENRPGAGGNIAAEAVIRSAPDGYTLLAMISGTAAAAALYPNLSFDVVRDTTPIAFLGYTPFALVVNPSVPAKTIPELIAYAKANPGKINVASAGVGTAPHLAFELFKMMTGVDMVHVPYRTSYLPDLLAGQVQAASVAIPPVLAQIQSGKLRALGVTSPARMAALPDVPPIGEFVPGYEGSGWTVLAGPKNVPADIVDPLNKGCNAITTDPAMKQRLLTLGVEPVAMTPAQTGQLLVDAVNKWSKVVKFAGIKAG